MTLTRLVAMLSDSVHADGERAAAQTFDATVNIALSSLISLDVGCLQKMVDSLHIFASCKTAPAGC